VSAQSVDDPTSFAMPSVLLVTVDRNYPPDR